MWRIYSCLLLKLLGFKFLFSNFYDFKIIKILTLKYMLKINFDVLLWLCLLNTLEKNESSTPHSFHGSVTLGVTLWVSRKIYIYIWEKVLFQNIEYLRMALILVLRSWHFTKRAWQSKGQDLKISNFKECFQLSFRKNIKNYCSAESESHMLKTKLHTSKT